jgi:hypothetical protein
MSCRSATKNAAAIPATPCYRRLALRPGWLLPLFLALCTLLPAELRARMVESCRERDECCCRRGEKEDVPTAPTLRRVDCCEAPCQIEHASATTATVPARRDLAEDPAVTSLPPSVVTVAKPATFSAPVRRGRDPPLRVHALTQRWLL